MFSVRSVKARIINHFVLLDWSFRYHADLIDSNDQYAISIEVQLLANGAKSGTAEALNKANNRTHTWNELDEKNDGKAIRYIVDEVTEVEEYNKSISETGTGNFVITNTHEVKDKVNPNKLITPTGNSTSLPSTGSEDGLTMVLLGGFLSFIAFLGVFGKKYKKQ